MSEVRNSEQKGHKYLYSEIFYGDQKLHTYFFSFRGSLYGLVKWSEPIIYFATVQLVTPIIDNRFSCPLLEVPTKSVGQETVFVERDTVLSVCLNLLNYQLR